MNETFDPVRYSVITEKNPREIVMLRGSGCAWRRCRFCDYHLDSSPDKDANFALNQRQLAQVTGKYHKLEVINSGSFAELDENTLQYIEKLCLEKGITQVHFESHWMYRDAVPAFRRRFSEKGIAVKLKIGVETFDTLFRESYLVKGIDTDDPARIAACFDEVCLLQGIPGQTAESMECDIETGLKYFNRVCVNIMTPNSMPVKPDPRVAALFLEKIYPRYIDNPRVDILTENTDFGVGGKQS